MARKEIGPGLMDLLDALAGKEARKTVERTFDAAIDAAQSSVEGCGRDWETCGCPKCALKRDIMAAKVETDCENCAFPESHCICPKEEPVQRVKTRFKTKAPPKAEPRSPNAYDPSEDDGMIIDVTPRKK